uniref:Uncharacterized protein n=1 Tax=Micrurus lemniscatus lemniscatus TaxID=129467 RepID=A0A2D4I131_MICLE
MRFGEFITGTLKIFCFEQTFSLPTLKNVLYLCHPIHKIKPQHRFAAFLFNIKSENLWLSNSFRDRHFYKNEIVKMGPERKGYMVHLFSFYHLYSKLKFGLKRYVGGGREDHLDTTHSSSPHFILSSTAATILS